ncbi:MAG: response regulator, partial [Lachnospiraceae bacterium]|nr:response regulator [Lachnospiraceae bacterium]
MHIPPHILILEDDEEIAMLEQDYLENAGYTSDVISDGTLAVGAILSGRYDLILLDVMLPGQNGYDICLDVRSRTNLPILMVTALDDSTDKIRGLGLG